MIPMILGVTKAEDTADSEPVAGDTGQKLSHVTDNMSALPLNDDILSHALQFSDFQSTCQFAQTNKKNSHISTNEHTNEQGCKQNAKPFDKMWRDVYSRHMFADSPATDVVSEIRRRRQLFDNLTGESRLRVSKHNNTKPSSKKSIKQCLSLPNRYVHFVPILPQLDVNNEEDREMMEAIEEDPPPCDFGCESFALLPGTSSKFILMDPYDGTIAVYDDVLGGAVRSDDAMMEAAFKAGADAIIQRRAEAGDNSNNNNASSSSLADRMEAETSGDAIEREVEANQNVSRRPPPAETLHSIEEYFATDLSEYFVLPSDGRGNNGNSAIVMTENDEVTVDWLGLDLHPIVEPSGDIVGNLAGAARVLTCESSAESALNVENGSVTRSCMEVLGWKSTSVDGRFDQAFVCRLKGFPNYVDIDANHDKVYATFSPGDGPSIPGRLTTRSRSTAGVAGHVDIGNDDDDLEDIELDWNGHPVRPSNFIVRYPFVRKINSGNATTDKDQMRRRYFPEAETFIETHRPVNCFVIDPTGEALVVGTDGGCVEVWTTSCKRTGQKGDDTEMSQVQVLTVEQAVVAVKERERERLANLKLKRLRSVSDAVPPEEDDHRVSFGEKDESMLLDDSCEDDNIGGDEDVEMDEAEAVTDGSNAGEAPDENGETGGQGSSLTQCKSTRKINEIFHPRHLGLHRAGFVTLQHHRTEGATLALWQKPSLDQSVANPKEKFELSAIINLPLSPQRKPQVHYDGRRLIVVGQDHIGVIVLIYHVLSTWEDKVMFDNDPHESYEHDENESGMPREESGGVINLSPSTRRVRYVNRIRNVGLGNLEAYDPIYCTCNERYVVVNTKCGNLIGGDGGTNACEGLFVIDLEDKE